MKNLKNKIREMFTEVFYKEKVDASTIAHYFDPDYTQYVDSHTLNYDKFIQHVQALKAAVSSIRITFEHVVEEGDKVCSVHIAEAVKKNGDKIKAKVISLFQFKNDKLILCNELTHLIEGNEEDSDLGSRH
jgi:ketosteroid isomerase-like protein